MDTVNSRWEILALALACYNGSFDPGTESFKTKNPGRLKTFRAGTPKTETDIRVFGTFIGGLKALISSLQSRCSGEAQRLSSENTLQDLLVTYGVKTDSELRKIVLFLRQSVEDESITKNLQIKFFIGDIRAS